jgi:hypothetical protein
VNPSSERRLLATLKGVARIMPRTDS